MCRNIKTLFNFAPPVTDEEIHAAALQFVRKVSGFAKPSKANEGVFLAAVDDVAAVSKRLLNSLETSAPRKTARKRSPRRAPARRNASRPDAALGLDRFEVWRAEHARKRPVDGRIERQADMTSAHPDVLRPRIARKRCGVANDLVF